MGLTTFSVGRDTQLVVMGPKGRVDMSHVTGFESRQLTSPIRVNRLDGTQLGAELPKGWEGYFEVERGTPALDDFISSAEQDFYNGDGAQSLRNPLIFRVVNQLVIRRSHRARTGAALPSRFLQR